MNKITLAFKLMFAFFISVNSVFAQEEDENQIILPDGLGLSNQLKYSYDVNLKREIFENWFNLDYRKEIFSAGIRFDIFQPNDPNPAVNRGKNRYADISFKYLKAEIGDVTEGGELTVGNFYALFGRGMILKIYEDRNIRIDNNLLGVKLLGRYSNFTLTALSGFAENTNLLRSDLLHAFDIEYSGIKQMKLGFSFASNQADTTGIARTSLTSIRFQQSIWNFDFYGEYGIKQNDDIKEKIFNGSEKIAGKAFYGNINFYYGSFSFISEYKFYDNFIFESNDGSILYNTPPSVRKDYTYLLLNRHPSPLYHANEKGFQAEATYNFGEKDFVAMNFGITKSLDANSYFQRVNNKNIAILDLFKEFFIQASYCWNDQLTTVTGIAYSEELSTNTKNLTPIIENRYYLDDVNSLRLILEHQQTTDRISSEQYFADVITFEYLRSPKLSISLISEMQTKQNASNNLIRKFWNFIQLGYKIAEHTDLTLLVGSRQAGNICVGGVCRYEPEFSGVEIKMFTRF